MMHSALRVARARTVSRVSSLCAAVCAVLCLLTASAAGQTPAPSYDDPAWQLYDRAFQRLAENDRDGARALLEQLHTGFPDHPAADQARERLRELMGEGPSMQPERPLEDELAEDLDTGGRPATSSFARAELSLLMTLNGVFMAGNFCRMLDCSSDRAQAATVMIGGGTGLGATLLLTRKGITQGRAQLIESAAVWGIWNSWLFDGNDAFDDGNELTLVLAQAGGLAAGIGFSHLWNPTSGQISMANSGFFWSQFLYLITAAMVVDDLPNARSFAIVGDLGIGLGALLGGELDNMSRGRTLVIDSGGILGALAGGLIALIGGAEDGPGVFAPLLLGTTSGLVIAGYSTRNWRTDSSKQAKVQPRLTLMPMGREGWGAGVSVIWP